jgi:hypothetical protein
MTFGEGLADLGSALGALQKASDILKNWTSVGTDKERAAKISELNGQILSAQTSAIQANATQLSLIEQVGTLKAEIAQLETWEAEKERYELKNVSRGATVYALKKETQGSEPSHWLCPDCYQNRKKRFFQYAGNGPPGRDHLRHIWHCQSCKGQIRVPYSVSPGSENEISE